MNARFNGAAALTLRKQLDRLTLPRARTELQWGRSVNAAETSLDKEEAMTRHQLQWGRSVNAAETINVRSVDKEELRLQWGRSVNAAETGRHALFADLVDTLQWGRSVNAAETLSRSPPTSPALLASMGPQR